ncbi:hypothetical protein [Blastococcus sp. CCUG 61487]|uniref:hypothetical protein n=1 Tax=Blastococcus sp. CCUG 61487 TaxID=1840703 RepID=UPI0010C02617|nr:hypothetical protein [Blastococcus sp. CCUG 61487]TKJ21679.1 hypothetical protein A6V29_06970 [Blastococcus sp. CCUG 61487]
MSRTDKTAPYRIKLAEHGDRWWHPELRCTCTICKEPQREASRRRRRAEKRQLMRWEQDYR